MTHLISLIEEKATQAIANRFSTEMVDPMLLQAEITESTQPQFGHYQCNSALKIAKIVKGNPRQIAKQIVDVIDLYDPAGHKMIEKIEIAGAGFINIFLSPDFLAKRIESMLSDERLGVPLAKREKIIVEFSSPNIAKELHVGHLRSTIIGDALARLFEFLGYEVLRLNHIGDFGTQFGMLIAYIQKYELNTFQDAIDLSTLMSWYKKAKHHFDQDPEFKKLSQLEVVKLQQGNKSSFQIWERICEVSKAAFREIYRLLNVRLIERGESFYSPYLAQIVADLEQKGLVAISNGAKCIFLDGFIGRDNAPLPMIVQKSDGGYNYETTDMAALYHRVQKEKATRIIIITDAGQSLHFAMIFKAAEKADYFDPKQLQLDHVPFGVVLGPDGKKFKTRSGETEKLIDLLMGAIQRAKQILETRLPFLSEEELEKSAKILGIDAVKYADLCCHRIKDYVFSYDRMLRFEGNTAAFLLYAYVRIQGIKRKIGKEVVKGPIVLSHPSEVAMAFHLCLFPETLQRMSQDLLPNRLCDYLYALAEKFHAFFRDCRVEGSSEENSRLLLSEATAQVLKKGLSILGLRTLERM
ncbi:Arginine--tRNA ligase [Candidatus Rhabdochlamydia oedothoracis]|uniref:Arginine--tRNA ligase n=1 Tax=Candidatus Rhabdochlamydia oedothoracis TaxID=2720720 RepID=A0ABX8V2G5_9BACT|nr:MULTISPECIES: arginine--tRNA ligase [Rhabdochlamydia]KAG6559700.1 Arginine--tRNA ligase [Candidatus Rhabdochlamydia sp. W815]MCL6755991.1 arginine--tRNA ligase [Candidatus Rhabdochlamydia oedothoracis]QYF49438.1 Arginine--tRNA ligase [Candidatus Rhabdochlamydia oedothoracis]